MVKLSQSLPLGGFSQNWNGVKVEEIYDGELVSLACANGEEKLFAAAFKKAYGKPLPAPQELKYIKQGLVFWTGQNQYMLLLKGGDEYADKKVQNNIGDYGYTSLQSDGWASVDILGERTYDALERFTALDLRGAATGFAARTTAHHIAVIFLKFSDTHIRALTPRSSAQSFLNALTHVTDNIS